MHLQKYGFSLHCGISLRSWNEKKHKDLSNLSSMCPELKHLKLERCKLSITAGTQHREVTLESLSLANSQWSYCGHLPFLGPQLRCLDVSNTDTNDDDLRMIVSHHQQSLVTNSCT